MSLSIATTDTLATVLPKIERAVFNREPAELAEVRDDYDYEIRLSLKNRLLANPRHGGGVIEARMSTLRPGHSYTIVADGREMDCERIASHGKGRAVRSQHELSLRDASGKCGHVHTLTNTNFVLTNKENCVALNVIAFDGAGYVQYRASTNEPWWRASDYSVVCDASRRPIAVIASHAGFWTTRRRLKLFGTPSAALIGLIMAADHGFIFRN